MSIEVHKSDIEMINISEDGAIYIESEKGTLNFFFEDKEIDLKKPIKIEGLNVCSGTTVIPLENEAQMLYFQEQLKIMLKD